MYVRRLDIFFQILLLKIASSYNLFLLREELNIVFLIDISLGKLLQIVKEVKKKKIIYRSSLKNIGATVFKLKMIEKRFSEGTILCILCEKKETRN